MIPDWVDPADPGMPDPEIKYHADNVTVDSVIYRDSKERRHRLAGPAETYWDEHGIKLQEVWSKNGIRHRTNGPAYRHWHPNGNLIAEHYHYEGLLHRLDGPSIQEWDDDGSIREQWWHRRGRLHRKDGPALIRGENNLRGPWFQYGQAIKPHTKPKFMRLRAKYADWRYG